METGFTLPLVGSMILNDCYKQSSPEERFNTIQLIYTRALEALKAIISDPLVGDQACQIRALKFFYLSKMDFSSVISTIERKIEEVNTIKLCIKNEQKKLNDQKKEIYLENQQKILKDPANKITIQEQFIKESKEFGIKFNENRKLLFKINAKKLKNDDILIDEDVLFIIESYFLTLTKTSEYKKDGSYKNKCVISQIKIPNLNCGEFTLSDTVFNAIKLSLSKKSVNFVKDLAVKNLYPKECLEVRSNKRYELPFLYMTEVIFIDALNANVPILLKIKNIKEKTFACSVSFNQNENKSCAIIIEAFSKTNSNELKTESYKKQLESVGILKIVSYNASQHSQFRDCIDYDEHQMKMKEEAIQLGFSMQNSSLCCIDHIFCDRISDQLKDKK